MLVASDSFGNLLHEKSTALDCGRAARRAAELDERECAGGGEFGYSRGD